MSFSSATWFFKTLFNFFQFSVELLQFYLNALQGLPLLLYTAPPFGLWIQIDLLLLSLLLRDAQLPQLPLSEILVVVQHGAQSVLSLLPSHIVVYLVGRVHVLYIDAVKGLGLEMVFKLLGCADGEPGDHDGEVGRGHVGLIDDSFCPLDPASEDDHVYIHTEYGDMM